MTYWKHGERKKLADAAGLPLQHISNILHRSRTVNGRRAKMLERVAASLGKDIPWTEWLFNAETGHPAFSPKSEE